MKHTIDFKSYEKIFKFGRVMAKKVRKDAFRMKKPSYPIELLSIYKKLKARMTTYFGFL